jgi:hypothetical protein
MHLGFQLTIDGSRLPLYICVHALQRRKSRDIPRDVSVFGLLVSVAIGLCNDRPECESEHYWACDKV